MRRLLFDEPLSEELCQLLADVFPGALHVRLLGGKGVREPGLCVRSFCDSVQTELDRDMMTDAN